MKAPRRSVALARGPRGLCDKPVCNGRRSQKPPAALPEFVSALILEIVRHALRKRQLRLQDADDLSQELTVHYLRRARTLAPAKAASGAFVRTMLVRRLQSWRRDRQAPKRGGRGVFGLGDGEDVADGDAGDRGHLAADIRLVLAKLPQWLRELAVMLMRENKSQAARSRGVPRTTQERQVALLRQRFERAGLAGSV